MKTNNNPAVAATTAPAHKNNRIVMNTRHIIRTAITALMLLLATGIHAEHHETKDVKVSVQKVRNGLKEALENIDDTALYITRKSVAVSSTDTTASATDTPSLAEDLETATLPAKVTIQAPVYIQEPESAVPDTIREIKFLIMTILIFAFPIAAIYITSIFNLKQKRERNRLIEIAIQNNYELPKEFFAQRSSNFGNINWDKVSFDTRNNGIKLLAWGIGGMLFFIIIDSPQVAALALIPIIIGASKVFSSRQTPKQTPNQQEHQFDPQNQQQNPPTPPVPPTF